MEHQNGILVIFPIHSILEMIREIYCIKRNKYEDTTNVEEEKTTILQLSFKLSHIVVKHIIGELLFNQIAKDFNGDWECL